MAPRAAAIAALRKDTRVAAPPSAGLMGRESLALPPPRCQSHGATPMMPNNRDYLANYRGSAAHAFVEPPSGTDDRWLSTEFYQRASEGFSDYDPSEWLGTLKFQVGGFMLYPWLAITVTCFLMTAYVELIAPEHREWFNAPLDAHTIMGAALSFLVVMRTDTSMGRWWDARESWSKITNCCMSIGAVIAPALRDDQASERVLMQLIAFVVAVKCDLRDEKISEEEIGPRMDWRFCKRINSSKNPPVQVLKAIMETVRENLPVGGAALGSAIFDEVSEQVRLLNQLVGTCRMIKTTPMTLGYVTTLRSILLLWLFTLPVALIGEFGWLAPPIIGFVSFLFLNVEQMAVEIEQPFGDDANDLPQETYILELEEMLLEMVPGFVLGADGGGGDDDDYSAGGVRFAQKPLPPPPTFANGGPSSAEGIDVSAFIQKYKMTPRMTEELLGLLNGGSGGAEQSSNGGGWSRRSTSVSTVVLKPNKPAQV